MECKDDIGKILKSKVKVAQWCQTLKTPLCPWNSPGKNIAVGCSSLLQRIFLARDRTGLLHCRQILYGLSHQGSYKSQLLKFKHTSASGRYVYLDVTCFP